MKKKTGPWIVTERSEMIEHEHEPELQNNNRNRNIFN